MSALFSPSGSAHFVIQWIMRRMATGRRTKRANNARRPRNIPILKMRSPQKKSHCKRR
jgi:hypothetical protein